ncbi:MAG TPA: FecR family protein [Bryobacterales bacterium]|jgi:ferric-dicitrate binding protein FerR (iron transport regulator)|nr:FecR family protein [Bryobacterales bacterium]
MLVSALLNNRKAWLAVSILAALAALPAPARADGDPGTAAKVVQAEGQVSVLRNSELWALFAGNSVRVGETIVTGADGYARLEVTDGSSFEVYPNSRVVFRSNPGNLRELLEVFLGKVKVHIQTLGGRPNPYRVESPTAVISVRGTVFEVAVESDNVTWVGVDEGLVMVEHRLLPGKAVPLAPGESLQIFPNASLAAAGIDKARLAIRIADAAREALYVLRTVGVGGKNGGKGLPGPAPGPSPSPLPTDKQAPPPPPPPPPPPSGP